VKAGAHLAQLGGRDSGLDRRLLFVRFGWAALGVTILTAHTVKLMSAQTAQELRVEPHEFEVATIKPTEHPDPLRKNIKFEGRRFTARNVTLSDLVLFAYDLQSRELSGGPDWFTKDEYDIDAVPDVEVQSSDNSLDAMSQWRAMGQKLLADRFKLASHREQRELPVYALLLGKSGPKLTKSAGDSDATPTQGFRKLGEFSAKNETLSDFARFMQLVVLDRPILDKTAIAGRFDIELNWTPDGSQFSNIGIHVPPPTDSPNAPPGLFTAIQEQLGLKLESTKGSVQVLVIDHVERPSAN
jgi:uncharacterized protein (TIGR03435 family)